MEVFEKKTYILNTTGCDLALPVSPAASWGTFALRLRLWISVLRDICEISFHLRKHPPNTHILTCTQAHACISARIASMHAQTCEHMHAHPHSTHIHEYVHIGPCVHTVNTHRCPLRAHPHMCTYAHACSHTYAYLSPSQFQLIPHMLSWNIFYKGNSYLSMTSHLKQFSFLFYAITLLRYE